MANILMINLPYSGHTNPTLPLSRELVHRGHRVDYINAPEWRGKIEETGANFIPFVNYPEGLSELEKTKHCFLAAYNTVIKLEGKYDLLIYEMLFFPGKVLAERLGIPCARQFSQLAWNKTTAEYYKKISFSFILTCRLIGMKAVNQAAAKQMNIAGKHILESIISDVPELNIVYLPSEFQPYRETFDERFIFAAPTFYPMKTEITIPYERMQKPIIYISTGSIISSKRFYQKCLRAFGSKDVTVILATGKVPSESLGRLPDNIYAYSYVPQLEVLQHSDLFITHGGMNSVNEAMYYGVPMLVMPIVNDQSINALQIVRLKIGKRMRAFPASANKLYKNAMEILQDIRIKENALAVQNKLLNDISVSDVAERIENLFHLTDLWIL